MTAASPLCVLLSIALAGPATDAPPPSAAPTGPVAAESGQPAAQPDASTTAPEAAQAAPADTTPRAEAASSAPTERANAAPTSSEAAPAQQPQAATSPPPPRPVSTQPESAPPPATADRKSRTGTGLIIGGSLLTAFGATSLVFVALPAAIVKSVAQRRAENDPLVEVQNRRERYRRARIADDTMEGGFWAGVTMMGVGIPMLITGVVVRRAARQDIASRLHFDPSGVTVKF